MRVELAPELSLEIEGPFAQGLDADEGNLVWRADKAVREAAEITGGARMTLTKNLPVASGIGGGSVDAAATVRALVRLWDVHPASHDLTGLALSLGADVPVCLFGRSAYMRGIGEWVEPGPALPLAFLVLVNPGVPVSTPAVFIARQPPYSQKPPNLNATDDVTDFVDQLARRGNDLEAPAMGAAPVIGEVIDALEEAEDCLLARMSGSGATCFGFFKTREQADRAAGDIRAKSPAWWVESADLIG
jgi:4-diphosphocytidyl-2C-methyl-D-erythritol 2-phosphate synthase